MGDDGLLGVLCADLWRIILQFLPLPSICELRCANSAFYELCAPVLQHRLHVASSSSTLFLYFSSFASTQKNALNTDFLHLLQGHSRKYLSLSLPRNLLPGFFLSASGGGLLLFCNSRKQVRNPRLLVYNPILGCWKLLPRPPRKVLAHDLYIGVNHGTSHYNVVMVKSTGGIAVYHSGTEKWDTIKLAHADIVVRGVHNGALYWVRDPWHNGVPYWDDLLNVTTLSTRIYETASEALSGFCTRDIFGVTSGKDGEAVLIVHAESREEIGTALRKQETDGTWTWVWGDVKSTDYPSCRIAFAGGMLCNVSSEVNCLPWTIDLKPETRSSNFVQHLYSHVEFFVMKPFRNVPWPNDVLAFQPSCTPVTSDSGDTEKKKKGLLNNRML